MRGATQEILIPVKITNKIDYITFVVGLPGARTHRFMRHLIDNEGYADYIPNTNAELIKKFPFHPSYTFNTGHKFPRLFDRLEPGIVNIENYYEMVNRKLYNRFLEQGKPLIAVSHTSPNIIRERYPFAKIYYIRCDFDEAMRRYKTFKSLHKGKPLPDIDWRQVYEEMETNKALANYIVNYEDIETG